MTLSSGRSFGFARLVLMMAAIAACGGGDPPQTEHSPSPVSDFDLPTDGEFSDWTSITEPEHYEADNLWEYMNGQADFFIDYGFLRVDTAEYRHDQTATSVVLEVFRMGRPQEAFGIFAAERTRDDRPLEIGVDAYLGTNVLGFWQGQLYVKVTSFDEGPAVQQSLIGFAREVSSRIPNHPQELEILLLFPEEGRVEASERFISRNFLGQPYLTDAYRVDYIYDDRQLQLFLVETDSAEEAESHFLRLEKFCRGRDQAVVTTETTWEPPTMIVDGPSRMVVFQIDRRLGGAVGMEDLEAGRAAAEVLAASMRARSTAPQL